MKTVHLWLWNIFSVHNLAVWCQCCFWIHCNVGENKDNVWNSSQSHQDCFNCQVAMTYSVELFICIVVGLVLGHAIFNSSMYLWWTECPLRIAHSWYLDVRRCRWRECGSLLRLANHSDQSAARGGPAHVGFTITVHTYTSPAYMFNVGVSFKVIFQHFKTYCDHC